MPLTAWAGHLLSRHHVHLKEASSLQMDQPHGGQEVKRIRTEAVPYRNSLREGARSAELIQSGRLCLGPSENPEAVLVHPFLNIVSTEGQTLLPFSGLLRTTYSGMEKRRRM